MVPMRQALSVPIRAGLPTVPHFGTSPFGMRGLSACGCGPVGGCGCGTGMGGLASTLDSIIGDVFGWASGAVQSALPTSAALPPNYGSAGSALTQITGLLPYIIGGYLLYKAMK